MLVNRKKKKVCIYKGKKGKKNNYNVISSTVNSGLTVQKLMKIHSYMQIELK